MRASTTAAGWVVVFVAALTGCSGRKDGVPNSPKVEIKDLKQLAGHGTRVLCVSFSPDGKAIASCSTSDECIKLWDIETGTEKATLTDTLVGSQGYELVAFSPDGTCLVATRLDVDHTILVLDPVTLKERRSIKYPTPRERTFSVAFSPDGLKLATSGTDKLIRIWEVASGKELATLAGHTAFTLLGNTIAYSPDGKTLVSGDMDGGIKLWDVAAGKELRSFTDQADGVQGPNAVRSVAFSPDGKRFATGYESRHLTLWEAGTGSVVHKITDDRTRLGHTLVFSRDGRTIISSGGAGDITAWDVATGKELFAQHRSNDGVLCLALSPDGKSVAAGCGNGQIRLLKFSREE